MASDSAQATSALTLLMGAPGDSVSTLWLLGVVIGILAIAYVVGRLLKNYPETSLNPAVIERFNHRVRVWWMMCAILVAGFLLGREATVVLFGFLVVLEHRSA